MMDSARYTGTEHPELLNEDAIVRPHPTRDDLLLAQFNNVKLGADLSHPQQLLWGAGWHELPVRDMPLTIRIPT